MSGTESVKDGVSVDDQCFMVLQSGAITHGVGDFNALKQGIPRNCRLVGHPEALEDSSLLLVIHYPYQQHHLNPIAPKPTQPLCFSPAQDDAAIAKKKN